MKPKPQYQPGDRIGGRYEVYDIKMGGMGEVYLCLDLEQNYPYALKTFQQRYQSSALRKAFEQEVATWIALEKHPNIVRCFYMDILDNQPFMALEWIAGEEDKGVDLRSWLQQGPLDLRTALDFTIDICRGLIHGQEKRPGLVHLDLKPENILVAQGGLAKITDFGLTQIVESAELEVEREADRRQGMIGKDGVAGTPAYMAPEQWRGELLDERTDIYAVGCILYEMLTGKWLYFMRSQHEKENVPSLPGSIPRWVEELINLCLAKNILDRPRIGELSSILEESYHQHFATPPKTLHPPEQFSAADYNNRGLTYDNLQQNNLALSDYNYAINLDSDYGLAYYNRGVIYYKSQQYELALADFNKSIEFDPSDTKAYSNRGMTYDKLGQHNLALVDYGRAIELDNSYATAYYNRGITYNLLQEYKLALADFNRSIELGPKDSSKAYSNRGITYANLQEHKLAMLDYWKAVDLNPNNATAYFNLGVLMVKKHDLHNQ